MTDPTVVFLIALIGFAIFSAGFGFIMKRLEANSPKRAECPIHTCACSAPKPNPHISPDNPMGRVTYKTKTETFNAGYDEWEKNVRVEAPYKESQIISSETHEGMHAPTLDIDYPAKLVPSSTDGHFHLYLDREIAWREYKRVLRAMAKAGLIEKGYADASIKRKATHLRLPWEKKKPRVTTTGRVHSPLSDSYTDNHPL